MMTPSTKKRAAPPSGEEVGARIRERMKASGRHVVETAHAANISITSVFRARRGHLSLRTARRLAPVLGLPVDDLLPADRF